MAEQTRSLDRLAVNAAETYARRVGLRSPDCSYGEAAKHFANAAAVFPPNSAYEDKRIGYLIREASALYQQGSEFGDNGALLSAIERRKRLLELMPRERVPLDWAMTQNNLGNALGALGERESGTARLEEAVAAYREALKERTRERVPLDWARTQNNLGMRCRPWGARERDGEARRGRRRLSRGAEGTDPRARAARLGQDPEQSGHCAWTLGERESGTAKLEEAVAAYREALKEWTRERVPLDWAATQNNLGNALVALGERESGTAKLEEAVAAYREALKEWTRERVPLDWAMTQNNLGNALRPSGSARAGRRSSKRPSPPIARR